MTIEPNTNKSLFGDPTQIWRTCVCESLCFELFFSFIIFFVLMPVLGAPFTPASGEHRETMSSSEQFNGSQSRYDLYYPLVN